MKQFLTLIAIFLSSVTFSQSSEKANCGILKHSKLKYLDGEDKTAYAVISNTNHVEYYNDGKYYIKSKLKWLNDCGYGMAMNQITLPNFHIIQEM